MKLVDGDKEIELEKVQVLTLHPGDTLVVTFAQEQTQAVIDLVARNLKRFFSENRVMVCQGGMTLSVIEMVEGDDG